MQSNRFFPLVLARADCEHGFMCNGCSSTYITALCFARPVITPEYVWHKEAAAAAPRHASHVCARVICLELVQIE